MFGVLLSKSLPNATACPAMKLMLPKTPAMHENCAFNAIHILQCSWALHEGDPSKYVLSW